MWYYQPTTEGYPERSPAQRLVPLSLHWLPTQTQLSPVLFCSFDHLRSRYGDVVYRQINTRSSPPRYSSGVIGTSFELPG